MEITRYLTRHGTLCHYVADQVIGASLRIYGEWAEEELYLLSTLVPRDGWVLDVGANVGTHALAFSRFVGPGGRVIAIDGQEKAFELLMLNRFLNGARNMTCLHAIAGTLHEVCMLPEEPAEEVQNLGACVFYNLTARSSVGNAGLRMPLLMIRLDGLELKRCDLMKLDVEAMELDVLRGSTETIARLRPIIYFEQTSDRWFQEIFRFFEDASYQLFWHVANPFNQNNFRGCRQNVFGGTRETNILAWPRERSGPNGPDEIVLQEIREPRYEPPVSRNAESNWSLPDTAYGDLPAVEMRAI